MDWDKSTKYLYNEHISYNNDVNHDELNTSRSDSIKFKEEVLKSWL